MDIFCAVLFPALFPIMAGLVFLIIVALEKYDR